MAEYELFGGKILADGSLSNARFLSDEVSPKFLDDANPWVRFAGKFTREDFSQRGWKWESDNNNEQRKQFEFVTAILATQYLPKVKKIGIVALMLSKMLHEVPANAR